MLTTMMVVQDDTDVWFSPNLCGSHRIKTLPESTKWFVCPMKYRTIATNVQRAKRDHKILSCINHKRFAISLASHVTMWLWMQSNLWQSCAFFRFKNDGPKVPWIWYGKYINALSRFSIHQNFGVLECMGREGNGKCWKNLHKKAPYYKMWQQHGKQRQQKKKEGKKEKKEKKTITRQRSKGTNSFCKVCICERASRTVSGWYWSSERARINAVSILFFYSQLLAYTSMYAYFLSSFTKSSTHFDRFLKSCWKVHDDILNQFIQFSWYFWSRECSKRQIYQWTMQ